MLLSDKYALIWAQFILILIQILIIIFGQMKGNYGTIKLFLFKKMSKSAIVSLQIYKQFKYLQIALAESLYEYKCFTSNSLLCKHLFQTYVIKYY